MSNKNQKLNFSINKIELTEHTVSIPEGFNPAVKNGHKFKLELIETIDTPNSIFKIAVRYMFYANGEIKKPALVCVVQSSFFVEGLEALMAAPEIIEKNGFHLFMIQSSLGHFRGIQAYVLRGTLLEDFLLPPIPMDQIRSKIQRTQT